MKLDYVLTACNNNEFYYSLIPLWISAWKKFYPDIKIKIIVISEKEDENLELYKDHIIYYKPIEKISTVFISQFIRILYPCLIASDEGILITDIDDIPLNSKYFSENIKEIPNDKFIYYRSWKTKDQYCIMYNIANQKSWQEIIKINNLYDLNNRLINIYNSINYRGNHGGPGWFTDQEYLYKYINEWDKKNVNFIQLMDNKCKFNRLNPSLTYDISFNIILERINNGEFSDYHIWRPYHRFINFNNYLIENLNFDKIFTR